MYSSEDWGEDISFSQDAQLVQQLDQVQGMVSDSVGRMNSLSEDCETHLTEDVASGYEV
jgi:hypothetical protein